MADISKIKALNGTTYDIKDSKAIHNVYDGLDSSSTDEALSANMGRLLNSNMAQILCKKSMTPGASQIAVGKEKSYNVDSLIPTGYLPISVCYEQYSGTSNAHLECSLLKDSSGHWKAALYNYYNTTLDVNPLITVWSVKEGYYS